MSPRAGSDSPPTLPPPLLDASPLSASFSYSSPGLPFIVSESTPKSLFWKPPAEDDASELGVAPAPSGTLTPDLRRVDQPSTPVTDTKPRPHPLLGPAPCSTAYLQSPYFGLGIAYQPTSARDSYPPSADVGAARLSEEEDGTDAMSQATGGLRMIKRLLTPRKGSNASQTSNATSAVSRVLARMSFLSDDTEPAVDTPVTVPHHDLDDLLKGSKAERRLSLPASPPPPVAGLWAPRRFSDIAGSPEVLQMSPLRCAAGKGPLATAVLLRGADGDDSIGHLFQVSPMQTRSMLVASASASTSIAGTPGPRFDSPVPQRAFMGGNQSASSSKFFEMFEPPRPHSPARCGTPPAAPSTPSRPQSKCATRHSTLEATPVHASPASPDMRVLRASTSLQEQLLPPRTSLPSHLSIISNMSSRKPSQASSGGQRAPSLREQEINTTARAMFFLGFIAPWCWLIGGWLTHRRLLSPSGSRKYIPKFITERWGAPGGRQSAKMAMSELPRSRSSTVLYAERVTPSSPRVPSVPHTTPALGYRIGLGDPWDAPQYGAPATYDLELAGLGPHRLDPWVRRCRVAAFVGSAVVLAACITAIGIALHVGLDR